MKVNSFEPIVNENSSMLILGTVPGGQSLLQHQYYAHKGNRFWELLSLLLKESLPQSYEERKLMLLKHRIGLWDVIKECDRIGSGDDAIKNEIANDFNSLLEKFPGINKIVFNGKNPKKYFVKHVKMNKPLKYFTLLSTSPKNNINYTIEVHFQIWEVILK